VGKGLCRVDYADLNPIDDPETTRIFYNGNTFGVFYFESPATRQVLNKVRSGFTFREYLRMDHFLLNVVVTSIIRPASNQSVRTWVSRLHGKPWDAPHPLLRQVLAETLGVMVFQEQLSQAAIHMAGFAPAEAESLRKVVSKKHRGKKLLDFYARFVRGARERGVDQNRIEEVWQMMIGFDGYSFCKPHSASYTLVAEAITPPSGTCQKHGAWVLRSCRLISTGAKSNIPERRKRSGWDSCR